MNEFFKKIKLSLDLEDASKFKSKMNAAFTSKFTSTLAGLGVSFLAGLKKTFNEAITELSDLGRYSRMTDSHVRDLKLGYGLSSSQAYGYDKAMQVMGFSSMEDLMWANSQEITLFRNAFQKYSDYYASTMTPEYVAKQLEYQVEMEMFKQDMQNTVIAFLMDNKETIMTLMQTAIDVCKFILSITSGIRDFFSGPRTTEEKERDIQNIVNSWSAKTTTINQANTYNNVTAADKAWVESSNNESNRQLIAAYDND